MDQEAVGFLGNFMASTKRMEEAVGGSEKMTSSPTSGMVSSELRFAPIPEWIVRHSEISDKALRLYALLAFSIGTTSPGQNALKKDLSMTDEDLKKARTELLSVGALSVLVRSGVNHYTLNALPPQILPTPSQVISVLEPEPEPEPSGYPQIRDAWLAHAPPLTSHRAGYFKEDQARRAVKRAVERHSLESVLGAIENYALVMQSPDDYRWSWSYSFTEFFHRPKATPGVDYFCPEANPLRNFRNEESSNLSAQDIFDQYVKGEE